MSIVLCKNCLKELRLGGPIHSCEEKQAMVDTKKLREGLKKLRGYISTGGCESCGYGSGFITDRADGEYLLYDDVMVLLDRMEDDAKRGNC